MAIFDDADELMKRVNEPIEELEQQQQEEDYNAYYREEAIAEENQKYSPGGNGNGKSKRKSKKSKSKSEDDEEEEPQKIISKSQFYKLGDHFIAEAVLIGLHNTPHWICYDSVNDHVSVEEFIDITEYELDTKGKDKRKKLLYPPPKASYLDLPYTFKDTSDIKNLVEEVKTSETAATLLTKIKVQWRRYVNESDNHITLCSGDCVFTYFQDKLGMTHFLFFIGDNETGKSSNLQLFNRLAYRNFLSTDMTVPNVFRFFGSDYEGIGTLSQDEADGLDDDLPMLRIHKSGYTTGIRVPRTDLGNVNGPQQDVFNTFGFRAFAAEKRPTSLKAKGFNERTIEMPCTYGLPDYDIVEVINNADDPTNKALLNELDDLRIRLLIYRMIHHKEPISADIDIGLVGREKQLWKPMLRVFQNYQSSFDSLRNVVSAYITEYREAKSHTQIAFLVRMISELIDQNSDSPNPYTLATSDIWDRYKKELPGGEEIGKTSYKSNEYGDMSQKRLGELLRDQFRARPPRHRRTVRELVFDKTVLDRMKQKYVTNIKDKSETDSTDETDVGLDRHLSEQNNDAKNSKNEQGNTNNSSKTEENDRNYTPQNADEVSPSSDNPSHVSNVSATSSSEKTENNDTGSDPDAYWNHGKWREDIEK
jgi:hypothetical protein